MIDGVIGGDRRPPKAGGSLGEAGVHVAIAVALSSTGICGVARLSVAFEVGVVLLREALCVSWHQRWLDGVWSRCRE